MKRIFRYSIPALALGAMLIGTASAAGWIFYTGQYKKDAKANALINDSEWTFKPFKALLIGQTIHLVYDDNAYVPGGMYKGEQIDGVDMESSRDSAGFFSDQNPTSVIVEPSCADYQPTTTKAWFKGLTELTSVTGLEYLDVSEVTAMDGMFQSCENLTELDFSSWNTPSLVSMTNMFYGCVDLTELDVSSFDTSSVTKMDGTFRGCESLESIVLSSFDTSSVVTMQWMFGDCHSLSEIDVGGFDVSSVENMSYMFYAGSSLSELDLSSFDTSKVTDMSSMFQNCASLTTIYADGELWSIESLENSNSMFEGDTALVGGNGTAFNPYYTGIERAYVDDYIDEKGYLTDIYHPAALLIGNTIHMVYDEAEYAVGDTYDGAVIDGVDTNFKNRRLTYISGAGYGGGFFDTSAPTKVVFEESFKKYKPTAMKYWFVGLSALESLENAENVDTQHVTTLNNIFRACTSLQEVDLSSWNVSNVSAFTSVFMDCSGLKSANVSTWDFSSAIDMSSFFRGCSSLTNAYIPVEKGAPELQKASGVFASCSSLTELDLTGWNVSEIADMQSLFSDCTSLRKLNVSDWDVSNLTCTITNNIFQNCSSLTELDLSSWKTTKLARTNNMFKGCSSLRTIYADPALWDMSNVTMSTSMFTGCTSLVGGNGTAFSSANTDVSFANVDGYNGQIGYLTNVSQRP